MVRDFLGKERVDSLLVKQPKWTKPRYWMSGVRLVVEIANSCIWSLSIANSVTRFVSYVVRLIWKKATGGKGRFSSRSLVVESANSSSCRLPMPGSRAEREEGGNKEGRMKINSQSLKDV